MFYKLNFAFLAIVFVLSTMSGCAPKYVHKSFDSAQIDRIAILPFMDSRKNPDPDLSFEKMADYGKTGMVFPLTYLKKYRAVMTDDIGNVSSYSTQDLPSPDPRAAAYQISVDPETVDAGWIKQLGPSGEQWVLVPVIEDLSVTNLGLVIFGRAKVSEYLFNKNTGELWWKCTANPKFNAGILAWGIMKASTSEENLMESIVVGAGAHECTNTIPKRQGPYLLPDN